MSALSPHPRPLPPECLELIIHHIAFTFRDTNTLATFLRINKTFFTATLPFLYRDPFRTYSYRDPQQQHVLSGEDVVDLTRLLLCSLPDDGHISGLLRAAYSLDEQQGQEQELRHKQGSDNGRQRQLLVPYGLMVTHIRFEPDSPPQLEPFRRDLVLNSPGLIEYIKNHQLTDRLLVNEPIGRYHPNNDQVIVADALAQELRRDMTWALAVNVVEYLQSLFIPLSDVTRYLALVPRLKSLVEVVFLMDRTFRPPRFASATVVLEPGPDAVLKQQQEGRSRHLEEMILFVEEHRGLHRNKLRSAECRRISGFTEECPEEFKERLLQLLPPLQSPRLIDAASWARFVTHLQDTNLAFVESISMHDLPTKELRLEQLVRKGPFLQRCRALESIGMLSVSEDAFEWAAKERRLHNAQSAAAAEAAEAGTTGEPVLCDERLTLVPLRRVNVSFKTISSGSPVNDILFAFHDTLESLHVHYNPFVEDMTTTLLGLKIDPFVGVNWNLVRLTHLHTYTGDTMLRIHPGLLTRTPQLSTLLLIDHSREYRLDDVEYWEPAVMPRLTQLRLKGSPAVSFHPETLRHSQELEHLDLQMATSLSGDIGHSRFIPPVKDFDASEWDDSNTDNGDEDLGDESGQQARVLVGRPIWTWDWDLPKLTTLKLNGEFAYRFRFRMLAGTPGLVHFSVNTLSWTQEHVRTIRMKDLLHFAPKPGGYLGEGGDIDGEDESEGQGRRHCSKKKQQRKLPKYLHLPNLTHFMLIGPWTFLNEGDDDHGDAKTDSQRSTVRLLSTLFHNVIPNVKLLRMVGSKGFSLVDWTASTRDLVRLKSAYASNHVIHAAAVDGDGDGSIQPALNGVDLFAKAGLQVVPGRPEYDLQYVLINPPESRKSAPDPPVRYKFI